MVFRHFVKAILNHRNDPSNLLSLHAVNTLKEEIAQDLIEAFRLSQPLATAHANLFWSSDSFFDFLIRVTGGPDWRTRASPRSGESRSDPFCQEEGSSDDISRSTTHSLEACRKERDELMQQYQSEKEAAVYWKKLYEECQEKLKEVEKGLRDKEKQREAARKAEEEVRDNLHCDFEREKEEFAREKEQFAREKEQFAASEKDWERKLETLEAEKKKEKEEWERVIRGKGEALEACERKLTAWTDRYGTLDTGGLPSSSECMTLECVHERNLIEREHQMKELEFKITELQGQNQQLMMQTPSHITVNYNTDLSGNYLSHIINEIKAIAPQKSNIVSQLQTYAFQLNQEREQLASENNRLENELQTLQSTTLARLENEASEMCVEEDSLEKHYPNIMGYLKEMIAFVDASTWEEEVVKVLQKKDHTLRQYEEGLRDLASSMFHAQLTPSNFKEVILEKLTLNEQESKEIDELYTYLNSKHSDWLKTSHWVRAFIKQDREVTDLLREHDLESVHALRESFNQLKNAKNNLISFIQNPDRAFYIDTDSVKWLEDFLKAVQELLDFRRDIGQHLKDIQVKDDATWLRENVRIYKILKENHIHSADLLKNKMEKFKSLHAIFVILTENRIHTADLLKNTMDEFNTLHAIFLRHSVNVHTIEAVLREREDFAKHYKRWCIAYGFPENTRIEDFDQKISNIPTYYAEWLNILQLDADTLMENFREELIKMKKEASTWKRSMSVELTSKKAKVEDPDKLEECIRELEEKSLEVNTLKEQLNYLTSKNTLAPSTLKMFFQFLFIRYFKLLYATLTKETSFQRRVYEDTLALKQDLLKKAKLFKTTVKGRANSDLLGILMKYVQYDLDFEFSSNVGDSLPQTEVEFLQECVEETTKRIEALANKKLECHEG